MAGQRLFSAKIPNKINEKSLLATNAEGSSFFIFLENELNTKSPVDNGQTSTKVSLHLF